MNKYGIGLEGGVEVGKYVDTKAICWIAYSNENS